VSDNERLAGCSSDGCDEDGGTFSDVAAENTLLLQTRQRGLAAVCGAGCPQCAHAGGCQLRSALWSAAHQAGEWPVSILSAYCQHTVRTLSAYCLHTISILSTYCSHTVSILFAHCQHTVCTMSAYCGCNGRLAASVTVLPIGTLVVACCHLTASHCG